jgi:transposase InsO family protein
LFAIFKHNCIYNDRIARWSLELQPYNLTVLYKKGALHQDVDALSRGAIADKAERVVTGVAFPTSYIGPIHEAGPDDQPYLPSSDENNDLTIRNSSNSSISASSIINVMPVLLTDNVDESKSSSSVIDFTSDTNVVAAAQRADPILMALYRLLTEPSVSIKELITPCVKESKVHQLVRLKDQFVVLDSVVYRVSEKLYQHTNVAPVMQLVIPTSLVPTVLRQIHDGVSGNHCGIDRTYHKCCQRYWWFYMYASIVRYVQRCHSCQLVKRSSVNTPGYARDYSKVLQPFDTISIDIKILPRTKKGNTCVLVINDWLTRWMEAYALPNSKSITVANALLRNWICRHGLPKVILSDNGSDFVSDMFAEICRVLGIKRKLTSTYHPASNGITERSNHDISDMVSHRCNEHQNDWDEWLPFIMWSHNSSINRTTGYTPYEALYARICRIPTDIDVTPPLDVGTERANNIHYYDYINELKHKLEVTHLTILQHLRAAGDKYVQLRNRARGLHTYNIGDSVLLFLPRLRTGQASKLSSRWFGPYIIIGQPSPVTFDLQLLPPLFSSKYSGVHGLNYQNGINVSRLKPYYGSSSSSPSEPLPLSVSSDSVDSGSADVPTIPIDVPVSQPAVVLPAHVVDTNEPISSRSSDDTNRTQPEVLSPSPSISVYDSIPTAPPIHLPNHVVMPLRRSSRRRNKFDPGPMITHPWDLEDIYHEIDRI